MGLPTSPPPSQAAKVAATVSVKASAKVSARPLAKKPAARSLADVALIGAGLASAAASVVFAAAMVTRGDHAPLVNGMQFLTVFGEPHLHLAASAPAAARRVVALGASGAPPGGQPGKSVDYDPTGSIVHIAPDDGSADDPYRLVAVEPGMAWLRNSTEMRVVKPGDVAPGLGRIAAIVMRGGRWTLVDDSGAALLTAEPPKGAAGADDPFARPMIFGDGD
jgi:hypothetical protein